MGDGAGPGIGIGVGGVTAGLAGGFVSPQPMEKTAKAATSAKPINLFISSFLRQVKRTLFLRGENALDLPHHDMEAP
jgi:hypothetical protein